MNGEEEDDQAAVWLSRYIQFETAVPIPMSLILTTIKLLSENNFKKLFFTTFKTVISYSKWDGSSEETVAPICFHFNGSFHHR